MRRWLAAVSAGLLAAAALALALSGSPARHGRAARAQASAAIGPLEAFVRSSNRRGAAKTGRAVPQPCSIEGSRCVRGCAIPVASARSSHPSQNSCRTASAARPCREMIGSATLPSTRGDASMCASPSGALRLLRRSPKSSGKP